MRRLPLRWLILIPILLTVTVGVAAFSVFVDGSVHADLISTVDEELARAERGGLTGDPTPPDTVPAPDAPGPNAGSEEIATIDPPVRLILAADGTRLDPFGVTSPFNASDLREIAALTDGTSTFGDPAHRVRTTTASDGTIAVTAFDLADVNSALSRLRRSLLGGAVVILCLQAVVVWLITSYLTRPLTRMAGSARRIAGGHLDTAIGEPTGSRETADLATDLDRMLHQLRATLDSSRRSAEYAQRSREDMQRFLADASHELRTPLTALTGYSDLYEGDMLGQPGALDRAMSRIGSESARMTRLVGDMLQLARTGAVAEMPRTVVDLGEVVADVVDDLRAAHPDVAITWDGAATGAAATLGNRGQLHQAILNIAANACRYAASGTPVEMDVAGDADHVDIRVVDHGPGIDPEHVEHIFLPFYRVDSSRSRDGKDGAGLGLAVAQQIVHACAGTITLLQTPGGGATFVIRLPAATEPTV